MALVNDNLGSTFIETDDELKYYFFKEDFKFWRQNRKSECLNKYMYLPMFN